MGPGFESQRDHKFDYSNCFKALKSPANTEFAGFFLFSTLSKNAKINQVLVRNSSGINTNHFFPLELNRNPYPARDSENKHVLPT